MGDNDLHVVSELNWFWEWLSKIWDGMNQLFWGSPHTNNSLLGENERYSSTAEALCETGLTPAVGLKHEIWTHACVPYMLMLD